MSAPRDPFGQEPTDESVYTTTLSSADGKRTGRTFDRPPEVRVRRQIFRLIVGMVAFLATIFVIFAAYDILGIRAQGDAPLAALQQFCSFEAQQDYSDAYNMVSPGYAELLSLDDFESVNTARDQRYGTVKGCSQIQRDYTRAFGPSHAAFSLTVTTTKGTYHGTVLLVQEGVNKVGKPIDQPLEYLSPWAIDEVSPDAHLDQ